MAPTSLKARLLTLLRKRYRMILVDDSTYRQTSFYNFTLGRLLLVVCVGLFFLWFLNTTVIAFTPVREWIPGYTDPDLKSKQSELITRMNAMERLIAEQDSFIKSLQRVSGYAPADTNVLRQTSTKPAANPNNIPAKNDLPVNNVANRTPVAERVMPKLIWPVDGMITHGYNERDQHYALDLAANEQSAVRAVADGFVILAEYSTQTGFVIGLQHNNGMVSFYKHNSHLFKKVGAFAFAGESIALVGNSGENSTGPHLHFELWQGGQPVDPLQYLDQRDRR